MTLQPIRDVQEYKRLKESLKARFESDRTGEQELFTEQTKVFQPLIKTHKIHQKQYRKKLFKVRLLYRLLQLMLWVH